MISFSAVAWCSGPVAGTDSRASSIRRVRFWLESSSRPIFWARSATWTAVPNVPWLPGSAPWRCMISLRSCKWAATGVPAKVGSRAICAIGIGSLLPIGARLGFASTSSQSRSLTPVTSARPQEPSSTTLVPSGSGTAERSRASTLSPASLRWRAARSAGKLVVQRVARWSSEPRGAVTWRASMRASLTERAVARPDR